MMRSRLLFAATTSLLLVLAARAAAEDAPTRESPPAQAPPQVTEAVVKAPVAELWRVFTTAEGYKRLGVAQCELDLRVGGRIRTHYDPKGVLGDDGTIENEILAFEPLRMIAFRVHKPPRGFPFTEATWKPTWSVVTFTDLGDGTTHIRLAGLGYTDTTESRRMREFFENGNRWVIQRLQGQYDAAVPTPVAGAHAGDLLAPIRHDRVVALPRRAAWDLYATSSGWSSFLGVEATIQARPGGAFEIHFDPTAPEGRRGSEGCTVLSLLPGEMLSHTWNAPPKFEHARARHTWVVVTFEDLTPQTTRVRLAHLGFSEQAAANPDHRAEWEQARAYFHAAWGHVLKAMAEHAGAKGSGDKTSD